MTDDKSSFSHKLPAFSGKYITALLLIMLILYMVSSSLVTGVNVINEDGDVLYRMEVRQDEKIHLEYTHSAMKTAVKDVYSLSRGNDRLIQSKSIYKSLGAGLEFKSGDLGTMRQQDGRFILEDIDQEHEKLTFRYGDIADQEIVLKNSDDKSLLTLPLRDYVDPGDQVNIVPATFMNILSERRYSDE